MLVFHHLFTKGLKPFYSLLKTLDLCHLLLRYFDSIFLIFKIQVYYYVKGVKGNTNNSEIHWVRTVRNDTEMFFKVLILYRGHQSIHTELSLTVCVLYSWTA